MAEQYNDPYDEEEDVPVSRFDRRGGRGIDLAGMGVRLAATVVVIGLGILIIYFALRPREPEVVGVVPTVSSSQGEEEPEVAGTLPIATFTPGATSTPPPLDEPTPAPASATEGTTGELAVGSAVTVTGTEGVGLNLRAESSTTSDIIVILAEG